MTEAEWLAETDHQTLAEYLRGRTSGRRMRLFACACCRLVWHKFTDERSRTAVNWAEATADDSGPDETMPRSVQSAATDAYEEVYYNGPAGSDYEPANAAHALAYGAAFDAILLLQVGPLAESLLRDIYGNPFRPVTLDPSWLTSTVTTLARQMYDTRDFSAMPILADALQDSGCEDTQVLSHCRGDSVHCRGCWVVDACLNKM